MAVLPADPLPAQTVTATPEAVTVTTTAPPVTVTSAPAGIVAPSAGSSVGADTAQAPAAYYPNCSAARAAGAAPLRRGDPGYSTSLDRDGDGIACE
ncbi:MAG: excalibur calcium-binding domain-containing protein [Actinomycetales bacterium]